MRPPVIPLLFSCHPHLHTWFELSAYFHRGAITTASATATVTTAAAASGKGIKGPHPPPSEHRHVGCSRPPSPPALFPHALQARGGAKLAPTKRPVGGGESTPSRPILGPITRRSDADSAGGKDKDDAVGDGQQEFAPQFLDFQSRVGFMKKVRKGAHVFDQDRLGLKCGVIAT